MVNFDPDRNPVEVLADEFTARCRRGECPSVTEYVQRYPDLAQEIRDLFPSIAIMEQLSRKEQTERDLTKSQVALISRRIERIGDYRIIREIGRGGMGVVYEAEQESLGRRVAVKVLAANAVSSPRQLQRFQREAQSAASLHHNNIVPVFGVGEQDGLHYYVMQVIEGVGLDVIIAELKRSLSDGSSMVQQSGSSGGNGISAVQAVRALRDGMFAQARVPGSTAGSFSASPPSTIADPGLSPRDVKSSGSDMMGQVLPESAHAGSGSHAEAVVVTQATDSAETTGPRSATDALKNQEKCVSEGLGERYWKSVAMIGLQLAEALYYAHSQGVLHRDIKPSNLMLDARGIVWITDFGLAKHVASDDLTNTGDIVGTLKYMAPEQFEGQSNTKTDIYSLGLTLYELLTLRSAVADSDRSTLIRQITQGEPTRPRKINSRIPRDLETIVLKAISREPAHRYRSAGELAADLQRFLDDRPILARQVTAPERLWRWCRRNPALAFSSGTAILLLIAVAVVASVGYFQTKDALARESEQRTKAETTLGISLEALDKVYRQFAPDRMVGTSEVTVEGTDGEVIEVPTQAVVSKETADLLEGILHFYDRFAEQDTHNAKLRTEAAKANRRVGDIHQRLGDYEQAESAYLRAIDKYQQLAVQLNGETNIQPELARIHNELGMVYWARRREDEQHYTNESRRSHLRALGILQAETAPSADSVEVRYELARTYYLLGRGSDRGRGTGSQNRPSGFSPWGFGPPQPSRMSDGRSRGGRPLQNEVARPSGSEADRRRSSPGGSGSTRSSSRDNYLNKAIALLQDLHQQDPGVPDYQHLLALSYRDNSNFWRPEGVDKAIAILESLCQEYPAVADYRYDLCETYFRIGERFSSGFDSRFAKQAPAVAIERLSIAERQFQKALEYGGPLVSEHASVPHYVYALARAHRHMGSVQHDLATVCKVSDEPADEGVIASRLERALNHYNEALKFQTTLITQFPDIRFYAVSRAKTQESKAEVLYDRGQYEEARSLSNDAVAALNKLLDEDSDSWFAQWTLHQSYSTLEKVLQALGEDELAAEAACRVEEIWEKLAPRYSRPGGRSDFGGIDRRREQSRSSANPSVESRFRNDE